MDSDISTADALKRAVIQQEMAGATAGLMTIIHKEARLTGVLLGILVSTLIVCTLIVTQIGDAVRADVAAEYQRLHDMIQVHDVRLDRMERDE